MAKIYKITNIINNKSYIGKTEKNIEERFKEHKKDINRRLFEKRPLYHAMNKYGIENFKIELLEKTNKPEEREKYYIKYYDTFNSKKGYNATIGGDGKAWLDYDAIIECYKQEQNATKVAQIMNCNRISVNNILKNNNIQTVKCGDHMKKYSIKVDQYDLNGNYIQTFNSYSEAGKWIQRNVLSKDKRHERIAGKIASCCNNERKTAYKFKWKKYGTVAESGLLR
jgi:group I intron endonuclease